MWLADAAQPLVASVVAPAAAVAGEALLLTRGDRLDAQTVAELQRLGTTAAVLAGQGLGPGVDADLARYGIASERFEPDASPEGISRRVAGDLLGAGARRAVCVEAGGFSGLAAPLGAALAAAKGYPLVVGVDTAKELASGPTSTRPVLTYLVGPEAAARAGELPGGHPLGAADWAALSSSVFDIAYRVERAPSGRVALVAVGSAPVAAALSFDGPILVHPPLGLDGVRDGLFASRDRFRAGLLVGATNALSTQGYYELQSIVNGFDAHKLIGVGGQGLPVIEQPESERPVGLARRSQAPAVRAESGYWTDRVRDLGG